MTVNRNAEISGLEGSNEIKRDVECKGNVVNAGKEDTEKTTLQRS